MSYDYRENMKHDIREYIENEVDMQEYSSAEELRDALYDYLLVEDSVTGNASGSYTFNREEAGHNLAGNFSLLAEALREFGYGDVGDVFEKGEEALDVITRCYLLWECLNSVIAELWAEGDDE